MLTDAQITILAADMQSIPELADDISSGNDIALAEYYNTETVDLAWKTILDRIELYDVLDWQEVIARSQAERDTLALMFEPGQVNPARANIRQGFADVFSGSQTRSVNQRQALIAVSQRPMTRIEKLFAVGPTAGVYTMTFEGNLSYQDASKARSQ